MVKQNNVIEYFLRQDQERSTREWDVDDEELAHVSLLPFRHVMPNGTYFSEDQI